MGEALALTTSYRSNSADSVIIPKRGTVVIAEVKFREIAVQMFLGAVLVDALHAALENREEAFDRIGVNITTHIFAARMSHGFRSREVFSNFDVVFAFIGMQARFAGDVAFYNRIDSRSISGCRMKRAHITATLYQRYHGSLTGRATTAPNVGLALALF